MSNDLKNVGISQRFWNDFECHLNTVVQNPPKEECRRLFEHERGRSFVIFGLTKEVESTTATTTMGTAPLQRELQLSWKGKNILGWIRDIFIEAMVTNGVRTTEDLIALFKNFRSILDGEKYLEKLWLVVINSIYHSVDVLKKRAPAEVDSAQRGYIAIFGHSSSVEEVGLVVSKYFLLNVGRILGYDDLPGSNSAHVATCAYLIRCICQGIFTSLVDKSKVFPPANPLIRRGAVDDDGDGRVVLDSDSDDEELSPPVPLSGSGAAAAVVLRDDMSTGWNAKKEYGRILHMCVLKSWLELCEKSNTYNETTLMNMGVRTAVTIFNENCAKWGYGPIPDSWFSDVKKTVVDSWVPKLLHAAKEAIAKGTKPETAEPPKTPFLDDCQAGTGDRNAKRKAWIAYLSLKVMHIRGRSTDPTAKRTAAAGRQSSVASSKVQQDNNTSSSDNSDNAGTAASLKRKAGDEEDIVGVPATSSASDPTKGGNSKPRKKVVKLSASAESTGFLSASLSGTSARNAIDVEDLIERSFDKLCDTVTEASRVQQEHEKDLKTLLQSMNNNMSQMNQNLNMLLNSNYPPPSSVAVHSNGGMIMHTPPSQQTSMTYVRQQSMISRVSGGVEVMDDDLSMTQVVPNPRAIQPTSRRSNGSIL